MLKRLPHYIDAAFCLVILPVMVMLFPIERWGHNFTWYVVAVGVWLYGLYGLNRMLTVKLLFRSGWHRGAAICLIVFSFAVTACFTEYDLYTPMPHIRDAGIVRRLPLVGQYQQAVWSLFMIVEAFSFVVGLLCQMDIQERQRLAVESERDKAQIALYKAQIKPHFMFNTLNTLYGLFLTGHPNALPSLERFIGMVRYVHSTSQSENVALGEEVEYIQQYVELQSLRLNDMTTVKLDTRVSNPSSMVAPMLLVTFVENCFKHGVSPVEKGVVDISITEDNGELKLVTSNREFGRLEYGAGTPEGVGLENCRKRLQLLYPSRHKLEITSADGLYRVELSITLQNTNS